jgi:DNA end-binding protein Ku
MVTIPVKLTAAARSESIAFNQIHKPCGSRIHQILVCKTCGETQPVDRKEIVKGYEDSKDHYLIFDPNELENLKVDSSETIEIAQFVSAEEVDPLYFDASYYLEPEKVGRTAYKLLLEALRNSGRLAIAKIALRQKESTVLIRPAGPGLALHTMFYANEIRSQELNWSDVTLNEQHLHLADQLMESMVQPFDPSQFRDEYQVKLVELIEAKREGKPLAITPPRAQAPVVDIMAALEASLAKKPAKKAPAREEKPAAAAAVQTSTKPTPAEAKPQRRTGTR